MKMNNLKRILSIALTLVLSVVLFAILAVKSGIVEPDAQFFSELAIITIITLQVKFLWFSFVEESVLESKEIKDMKTQYDDKVTTVVTDITDFEEKLKKLDQLNVENYISNKLRNRTKDNYKGKYLFFFKKDYEKLLLRIKKKATKKVKQLNSSEILTRCETKLLYDSKNKFKIKKRTNQIFTTITSMVTSVVFAMIAYEGIKTNPEIWFKYVSYLFVILQTVFKTLMSGSRITKSETIDYLTRLENIIDKYDNMRYRELEPFRFTEEARAIEEKLALTKQEVIVEEQHNEVDVTNLNEVIINE